jgi:hypothetical protein
MPTLNLHDHPIPRKENECAHEKGTVTRSKTYPATREEPAETVGTVVCDECGESFELGYTPEGMKLVDERGREW